MPHRIIVVYPWLCAAVALGSLLLTFWAWHADPIINNDGTEYIRAATHFVDGEWQKGLEVYKWPFYSLVSGLVAKLTGLTVGQASYAVVAGLYVLLIWGFLAVVQAFGAERWILWLGAGVVLLHPELNKYRSFIIRDIGYWAFYLWSLAYFICYVLSGSRQALLFWAGSALLAALFRVEGIFFVLLLPIVAAAGRASGMRRRVNIAAAILLGGMLFGSVVLWQYAPKPGVFLSVVTEASIGHLIAGWAEVGRDIGAKLYALNREFQGQLSLFLAWPVYLATMAWMVIGTTISAMSVMYAIVAGYYVLTANRVFPRAGVIGYWWTIVVIHLLYLVEFAFINFFLTNRYPMALALTLLICVPFGLQQLWDSWRDSRPGRHIRWVAPAVAALIVVAGIEGLAISSSKHYLKDAGSWLQANMRQESNLYSNERRVIYYAGKESAYRPGADYSFQEVKKEIWTGRWRNYDYLALYVPHDEPQQAQYVAFKIERDPIKSFENEEGDRVLIFQGGKPE